jgi:hypothetical protein
VGRETLLVAFCDTICWDFAFTHCIDHDEETDKVVIAFWVEIFLSKHLFRGIVSHSHERGDVPCEPNL